MTALDAERLAQGEIKQNNYLPFKTRNMCMSNSVDFTSKNAKALLWGMCMSLVCILKPSVSRIEVKSMSLSVFYYCICTCLHCHHSLSHTHG